MNIIILDPVKIPPNKNYWCNMFPYYWPYWVGGNYSFLKDGQPFEKLDELRISTMLEF